MRLPRVAKGPVTAALCGMSGWWGKAYSPTVSEGATELRVWIQYKERWYPGLLETWNERDGTLRGWVSYAAPVNGWEGGWYAMTEVRSDDGDSPNNDGRTWSDVATR